ncbi:hypothetical protein C0Q70_00383 [Pomacea canaliculata]|uniref:SRCR domain-containing protein n=1 Tax=Pomacea canaliculata TaxID=400727 RepID=A0A2T7PWI2_POMCA|nr:hypothetical protein C0Q70_00383 [Pomacea canaliculata]
MVTVRLVPQYGMALAIPYGNVEFFSGSTWLPVCDTNWDDVVAKLACGTMGYVDGVALCCNQLGRPLHSSSTLAGDMTCTGRELSLLNCSFTTGYCPSVGSAICYNSSTDRVNMTFSVRLLNDSKNWGEVEVRHRGVWGFVCEGPDWTDAAARVVCKELGFSGGGVRFGGPERVQFIWQRLGQCCPRGKTGRWRLQLRPSGDLDGRANLLRVRQRLGCERCNISLQTPGYQTGRPSLRSYYGAGTGQVALDRVACRTWDTSLLACRSSGWLETEAACGDHSKDAGVICFGEGAFGSLINTDIIHISCLGNETQISSCASFQGYCGSDSSYNYASVHCFNGSFSSDLWVSLEAGQGLLANSSGRLVVTQGGVRGRVCPEDWDDVDVSVVCRQLRYHGGVALAFSDRHWSIPAQQCGLYRSIVVQLVGGITDKEGLVQVVYGSHVGTVCVPETYRSFEAANAVCRQLGYMDGVFTKFPRGSGTVSMSDVFCTGYETSVFMCRSGGLFVPPSDRCANHDFDLGVHCSDGGTNGKKSLVVCKINRGSGWINICNDFFGDLDAQVVCRSEGYRTRVYCPRARWVTKTETTCLSQP